MSALRGPVVPILLAAGIIAASAAGTAALTAKGKHSDPPSVPPPVRNAAWTVDGAHDAPTLSALSGFWIGADVVVRGGVDGLHASKRSDGSSAWDTPVPNGGSVCGMSAGVDGGVGLMAFEAANSTSCTSVSAIDLPTGKILWTAQTGTVLGEDHELADEGVASGTAVLESDGGAADAPVVGLDLRSGTVKWKHTTSCKHLSGVFGVGGGHVATGESCQNKATVQLLDAATGATVPAPVISVSGQDHAAVLAVSPLAVVDDADSPNSVTFGPAANAPVSRVTIPSHAQAAAGGGVLCLGGKQASCWTAAGAPLTLRGLPDPAASPQDVISVYGPGDAARFVSIGTPGHPRASLYRVGADGRIVIEADLSQPVSDFLGNNGSAQQVYAYADAKDLYLVVPHPAGATAVVDVRLG